MNTCRFCGELCDSHSPVRDVAEFAVKYGKRHHAHVSCAVKKQGTDWVLGLRTWQIEMLPHGLVKAIGMANELAAELERRSHTVPPARLRLNLKEPQ